MLNPVLNPNITCADKENLTPTNRPVDLVVKTINPDRAFFMNMLVEHLIKKNHLDIEEDTKNSCEKLIGKIYGNKFSVYINKSTIIEKIEYCISKNVPNFLFGNNHFLAVINRVNGVFFDTIIYKYQKKIPCLTGRTGNVYTFKSLAGNDKIAVKFFNKDLRGEYKNCAINEVRLTTHLNKSSEISLKIQSPIHQIFEHSLAYYTEKYQVDLFELIDKHNLHASNKHLGYVVREYINLASSLESLHKKGVAHGDFKLENILVKKLKLFISDFGNSLWVENGIKLSTSDIAYTRSYSSYHFVSRALNAESKGNYSEAFYFLALNDFVGWACGLSILITKLYPYDFIQDVREVNGIINLDMHINLDVDFLDINENYPYCKFLSNEINNLINSIISSAIRCKYQGDDFAFRTEYKTISALVSEMVNKPFF